MGYTNKLLEFSANRPDKRPTMTKKGQGQKKKYQATAIHTYQHVWEECFLTIRG